MHNLVAHIDRGAKPLQGALDNLDGAIHPGAEAARRGKQYGEGPTLGSALGHSGFRSCTVAPEYRDLRRAGNFKPDDVPVGMAADEGGGHGGPDHAAAS
ncbi:hypothetical protein DLREEDagr8_16760 [Dongia sp. agr-C8]